MFEVLFVGYKLYGNLTLEDSAGRMCDCRSEKEVWGVPATVLAMKATSLLAIASLEFGNSDV